MDTEELRLIIESGENQVIDFKKSEIFSNPHSIAKLMVAFANTMGGKLIIGVNDDKSIEGLKNNDGHERAIMNIARDKCDPPISPTFQLLSLEDGDIYVISIPKFKVYPHAVRAEGGKIYYIRVGTTIREPSPGELKQLFEGITPESLTEASFVETYNLDFLREYMNGALPYRVMRIFPKRDMGKLFDMGENPIEKDLYGDFAQVAIGDPHITHDSIRFLTNLDEKWKNKDYLEISESGYLYYHEAIVREEGVHVGRTIYICNRFLKLAKKFYEYVGYSGELIFCYDFINLENDMYLTNSGGGFHRAYSPSQADLDFIFKINTTGLGDNNKKILVEVVSRFVLSFGLRLNTDSAQKIVESVLSR
jgi:hypothetical protein